MTIRAVLQYLEQIAPPVYQESYDNARLIVGDSSKEVSAVLLCLDSTEAVIEEAIEKGCNLVVAHHPIVFKGLKSLTGKNYVERVLLKAIKADIAIYAIHTNLDNMYHQGVNAKIAARIGLEDTKILAPKAVQKRILAWGQMEQEIGEEQLQALSEAGGLSSPPLIQINRDAQVPQLSVAFNFRLDKKGAALKALENLFPHSNWEYNLSSIDNKSPMVGSGMIGRLPEEMSELDFLKFLKDRMQVSCIRHTALLGQTIKKVAVCGGAGGFLLNQAKAKGADIFITADYKYHEFFDADGQIIIADIGHYESEQFTIELLHEIISKKFSNFAAYCTAVNTNPVHYLF